jgi:hypothetical protein
VLGFQSLERRTTAMINDSTRASQDRFLMIAVIVAAISTALMASSLIGSDPRVSGAPADAARTIR